MVGSWWHELKIEYKRQCVSIVAYVYSNIIVLLFSVMYLDRELGCITLNKIFYGHVKYVYPKTTTKVRTIWESTGSFQSPGLSTYYSSGEFHVEQTGMVRLNCENYKEI